MKNLLRGPRSFQPARFVFAGFSLVEMVIALAVISVTFIGIIGLLGVGLVTDQTSSEQTTATNIADSIIDDLRSTPNSATTSTRFGLTLPTPPSAPNTSASPLSTATATATTLYFDINGTFLTPINASPAPSGAVYAAKIYSAGILTVSPSSSTALGQTTDIARIVVTWPAAAVIPSGSMEVVTQFRLR